MLKVYSRKGCERCARVKKELSDKSVPFVEEIIGVDVERETVMGLFPGAKALPILALNGRQVDIKDL